MKVVVAKVSDFAEGERRIVEVEGGSVGVFRVGDNFYALRNFCPHQGGPLCIGAIAGWPISDKPGEMRMDDDAPLLACPWHGWEYDLATGQSFLGRGNPRARRYEVSVSSGADLVGDAAPPVEGPVAEQGGRADRIPGPYIAETVPVEVSEQYVVVDA